MSPFLRGDGEDTSSEIWRLDKFVSSESSITKEDKIKFHKAYGLHIDGDLYIANKIYLELLENYSDNKVLLHNLKLIK